MPHMQTTLRAMAQALDDLDDAFCAFDELDCALAWNRTFLNFFPEHAGHIHVGEPYRANLRRFYQGRLHTKEIESLERYVEEGLARHRAQQRPYEFEHLGRRMRVASRPLTDVGRIRIWKDVTTGSRPQSKGEATSLDEANGSLSLDKVDLLKYVPDGFMVTDPENRILWVNEPFAVLYGLTSRPAFIGTQFADVFRLAWADDRGEGREAYDDGRAVLVEHLRFAGSPFELRLPGGRCVRVTEQRSPQGWGFFSHVDITVLKEQQHRLVVAQRQTRASETLLREKTGLLEATLQRMEQGVLMVNAMGIVEVCNRRAVDLLGLPAELMASKPLFAEVLAFQWDSDEFVDAPQEMQAFVRSGGMHDGPQRYDRTRPDGRVLEIQSVPIEGGGILRTYTDITERKRAEDRIRHIARHDGLTALVNREVFLEHLAGAVQGAQSSAEQFAVLYLDLDAFKPVNDRLGHAIGDKVLAVVASRMRGVARDTDVVARMGGDEFAILQRHIPSVEQTQQLARRVVEAVRRPIDIEGRPVAVGVSIGVALYPAHGVDADELLRNADSAMYQAKSSGPGRFRVFGQRPGT